MAFQTGARAAGLLSLLLSGTSVAQDRPATPPDPLDAAADWNGFHFGAALGTPVGDNTWVVRNLALELVPDSWSGTPMTLSFGRDWQVGRLTYGGLVSVATGQLAAAPTSAFFFTCVACQTTVEDLQTLRGRLGWAAGAAHVFATGGLARADVAATNVGGAVLINAERLQGWTLGLGVERRISEGLSVAMTYDHVDLGSLDLSSYVPQTDTDIRFDLMQVGMTVRW